jgi:hypothetical protein
MRSLGDYETRDHEPSIRSTIWGNTVLWHPDAANWDEEVPTCMAVDANDTLDKQALAEGIHPNSNEYLEWILRKSWEIETAPFREPQYGRTQYSVADMCAIRTMDQSLKLVPGKGYKVAVPWKQDEPTFKQNQGNVKWMTEMMELKLYKDAHVGSEVDKTFKEYLDNNFIVEVSQEDEHKGYYITWFCVVRPEKETTKVRTVFNCAQNFRKPKPKCLNDGMYTGPKLHNELFNIIMRMRQRQVFIGADISKFYMRIRMAEEDQRYHRFYWRGKAYQFTRWPFGNKAAPIAALYVVQNHIKTYGSRKLQEIILPCMYMDDILFSVDTVEEAQVIIKELRQVLLMADMPLSKWVSSHPEALKDIPKEEQSKDMFLEDPDGHSTLGVGWKPDKLTFKPKKASEGNLTRRKIASIVSGIFDPLGWLAPKSLEGRIVLQGISLKKLNITWDTDLDKMGESSEDMKAQMKRFRKWEQELSMLDQISYPRAIYKPKPIKARQLQIFTDGSQHAYAAMAYIKITYEDGEKSLVFLCCARRITPTNGRSTPETELLGAVTGAELGQRLATLLDITGRNVRYWTDSTPVLTWIRKAGKKNKVFVVHRTTAIHDMTDTECWDYVPTKVNPADLPTRGCTIKDLVDFTLFWKGPAFVMEDEDRWPNMIIRVTDEERFPKDAILWFCTLPQPQSWIKQCSTVLFGGEDTPSWITQCGAIKTSSVGLQQAVKPAEDQERTALAVIRKAHKAAEAFPVGSFGKWSRAVRTMARMKVIMRKQSNLNGTEIRPEALMEAAATLIIMAQVQVHEEDIKYFATHEGWWNVKSPIHGHGVYFDQYGMMRVSSRAQLQQDLPLETMFPIWFPKGTWVGRLILYFKHSQNHSKTKRLAQEFMTRFFCNGLYQAVGTINKHCMTCRKKHGPGGAQIMGQVPDRKMGSLKQFNLVSMDTCGQFTVKILNTSMKVWVLVLACLQTKAIHLEILEGLKTDEVINALERAVARKGNFKELHADNFASFIAAKTIITREQQASLLHASLLQASKAQKGEKAGGSTGNTV